MKRNTTILILCGMFVLADIFAFHETLLGQTEMSSASTGMAILAESCAAAGAVWLFIAVVRKNYRRQKKPISRWRLAVERPLRRLFVS